MPLTLALPQQPVVFLSKRFLERLCALLHTPFVEIEDDLKGAVTFLSELVFQRASVYLDMEIDELARWTAVANPRELPSDAHRSILPHLQKLGLNAGRLRTCATALAAIRRRDYAAYTTQPLRPHFLLLSDSEEECCNIQDAFGIVCISPTLKTDEYNLRVGIEPVCAGATCNPMEMMKKVSQAGHIVIEDPYFGDEDTHPPDYWSSMLAALLNEHFRKQPLQITFIVSSYKRDNSALIEHMRLVEDSLEGSVQIEVYETAQRIHDRSIYSNSYWISCGYGFMKKYGAPTQWTYHPLGLYYAKFAGRLNATAQFMQRDRVRARNELLRCK